MLDLPAIKKLCEADPTVVFIGDEVLLLVEALEEAQGKLDAVEWAGRDDLGVACCPTCGFRRAQGHAAPCAIARIMEGE